MILPFVDFHIWSTWSVMNSSWSVHDQFMSHQLLWDGTLVRLGFFWQGSSVSLKWVGCLITVPKDGKGRCCDPWGMQVKGKFHKWHRSWMPSALVYVQWSTICSSLIHADYLQLWTTWFLMLHISSPADMSSSYPERKYLSSFLLPEIITLTFSFSPSNLILVLICSAKVH